MPISKRLPSLGAVMTAGLLFVPAIRPVHAQGPGADSPDRVVGAPERARVIEALSRGLRDRYVFPETADKMAAALDARVKAGAYDAITSAKAFGRLLTGDLAAVAHDKHLRVMFDGEGPRPGGPPPGPPPQAMLAAMNFGFQKVERLAGNVGYLRFDAFMDPGSGAGDVAAGALGFLNGTDALIIDLRENHGGSPAMVAFLCTYFFPEGRPVHLNDLYWRASGETQQWWTLGYVPGKRYVDKPVYLLTSSGTFSAGEEFVNNLKTLERATVVGETTGGGANPGGVERLAEGFVAFIPGGRAINPITKGNWEGTGIAPDVAVPAAMAFDEAYRLILTKLAATKRGPMLDRESATALAALPR